MTRRRPADVMRSQFAARKPVWVLANNWRRRRAIRREYLFRIRHAKRSVDIANSYFIPDSAVRRALYKAVARGARVRVLVPAHGDVPIVQYAVESLFDPLLKHGIEVYSLGGPMLHCKTAVIDDFTTIGSYNLDERSWRKNLEVNLAVEDAAFADHVRQSFDVDISNSVRMDLTTWGNAGRSASRSKPCRSPCENCGEILDLKRLRQSARLAGFVAITSAMLTGLVTAERLAREEIASAFATNGRAAGVARFWRSSRSTVKSRGFRIRRRGADAEDWSSPIIVRRSTSEFCSRRSAVAW